MVEIPKKMVVTSELEKNLIFDSLKKLKQPMNITADNIEYSGVIEKIENELIHVTLSSTPIGDIEGTHKVNFVFNNNYHYFTTDIHQQDEGRVVLVYPEELSKNIQRRYDRVNVDGEVFMKFKIMIQSEKAQMENSSLLDERIIAREVKKPRPAVDKMLKGIKNLVSEFSQQFQVKVFKEGERLSFVDKLIKDTGKIFLIYNSYEDAIEDKRFYEDQVLTVGSAYDFMISRGDARKACEDKLLDMLQQLRNKRIFSECYVPLMLEGEAVGYIRLINDIDYHRSLKPGFAKRTARYADLLVEALVKYDYFSLESGSDFDIPLINISAGGLLFRLEKENLKQYLIKETVLQMSILFPDRQIEARGIVFRIDKDGSEYGMSFQEINNEDMAYINKLAKKRKERDEKQA
ncbi:MAG: PilZ domain-containing protein [Spirochaetota bacterium]|nr:MAG: PilZ domain-containing protein [Spirochaetota bacterium]